MFVLVDAIIVCWGIHEVTARPEDADLSWKVVHSINNSSLSYFLERWMIKQVIFTLPSIPDVPPG